MRRMARVTRGLAACGLFGLCACASTEDVAAPAAPPAAPSASSAPLPVPFVPSRPPRPVVDAPYLQEQNHATEVERGLGPLVAVVLPPPGHALERPTQVTPRGLVRRVGGVASVVTIEPGDAPLIGAAASSSGMALVSPSAVYLVAPDGSLSARRAPEGVTLTGVAAGRTMLYLLTNRGLGWIAPAAQAGGQPEWPSSAATPAFAPTAVLEGASELYVGTATTLSAYALPSTPALGEPLWTLAAKDGLAALPVKALVGPVKLPRALDLVVVGAGAGAAEGGLQALAIAGGVPRVLEVPELALGRVPLANPRAASRTSDGGFVVATDGGAYRVLDRGQGPEWRVYNQERWVPSEDLRGVTTDPNVPDGPLWFATAAGMATVTATRMTLEEKLAPFVERVVTRHDRDGAVADSHLLRKGDLTSNIPWDSDNDGSWTSYWLLAECYRHVVTGDPAAKAHFDRALEAMLRLRDLTGTEYFVARSVIRKDGCQLDDCANPDDGAWYESPDRAWWVKRDTSNDEVIAHLFMMGPAYDLCADDRQRARIRAHVGGIMGGIVDHGFRLLDPVTGKVTTYGQFDPPYVLENFAGKLGDGGVRAATVLGGLTLAHYMTGEERFRAAKTRLITEHHYDEVAEQMWDHPLHQGNNDGDELGTEMWTVLLRYESDARLRALWKSGWRKKWDNALGRQRGAWWTFVHAMVGESDADLEVGARWLRLAPVDMIRWDQHNSQRRDLAPAPRPYGPKNTGVRSDGDILPYDERACERWNTDQFRLDGGMGGMLEMDGADVLAPYWMARYYGLIVPAKP